MTLGRPDPAEARSPVISTPQAQSKPEAESDARRPEQELAMQQLEQARKLLLSASIAFCDNLISAGQLRAVRELLRERELRAIKLEMAAAVRRREEPRPPPSSPFPKFQKPNPAVIKQAQVVEAPEERRQVPFAVSQEFLSSRLPSQAQEQQKLEARLKGLEEKLASLEQDFRAGRINTSQYRAVRQHYLKQREAAMRIYQAQPESDRWQTILEEGKTTFLLQLNEAACRGVALYDLRTREQLHLEGELPAAAEEAMALLGTFRPPNTRGTSGRMYATQTDDGTTLLLIPGHHTAALVVFSEPPPGWQVGALREVQRNFEAANRAALERGQHKHLVFPDLRRFVRG